MLSLPNVPYSTVINPTTYSHYGHPRRRPKRARQARSLHCLSPSTTPSSTPMQSLASPKNPSSMGMHSTRACSSVRMYAVSWAHWRSSSLAQEILEHAHALRLCPLPPHARGIVLQHCSCLLPCVGARAEVCRALSRFFHRRCRSWCYAQ